MPRYDGYDISKAAYTGSMTEKNNQYVGLIRKAERVRRERNDSPSKDECMLYVEAAKVCEEIRDMNLSQRAVYTKWEQRRMECEATAKEIADSIAPPRKPTPPPPPEEPEPDLFSTYPEKKPAKPVERPKNPTPPPTRPAQNTDSGKPAQQVVQTASGFTTKNAVKEVTADTIEKWYKPMPNHGFDDVVGMEELKERLVREAASIGWTRTDDVLKISPLQSYLFYGPPGTGKTFLIEAFAHKLMEEHGFKFIQLSGGDIHASLVGVAEKTVDIAFQEAIDNAPCILFIDEFEEVCKSRNQKAEGHEKRLTVAFLEAYSKLKESGKRVVFMGATNHPGKVDGAMMSRLKRRILIPLPEEKAKEAYFARKFGSLSLEDGFTFEDMAETTDNYSYRDLDSLHDIIAAQMKQEAIEDGQVRAADGSVDLEKSDIAVSESLKRGDVRVTKELFKEAQKEQPPTDQTEIRKELEEFERSVRAGGGQ